MAIIWKDGRFSSVRGYVGDLELFTVSYDYDRRSGAFYPVESRLPTTLTLKPDRRYESQEEAQKACERELLAFTAFLVEHTKGD